MTIHNNQIKLIKSLLKSFQYMHYAQQSLFNEELSFNVYIDLYFPNENINQFNNELSLIDIISYDIFNNALAKHFGMDCDKSIKLVLNEHIIKYYNNITFL